MYVASNEIITAKKELGRLWKDAVIVCSSIWSISAERDQITPEQG
jgi:hypothetical protein